MGSKTRQKVSLERGMVEKQRGAIDQFMEYQCSYTLGKTAMNSIINTMIEMIKQKKPLYVIYTIL